MQFLFAYGSLLDPMVQKELFNRTLTPEGQAVLFDWRKHTHEEYPFITAEKGSQVKGEIIVLTEKELSVADKWEEAPDVYQRKKLTVQLMDGSRMRVWVYTRKSAGIKY
ncbi:MAG: gamma-glutamylcyclotransferase [Bacteroidales bacterium]|nr:gamma-glutamylcyclotransferase [Bacteroidales bacterium]